MITKLRPNILIGDKDAFKSLEELQKIGVTRVIVVADELQPFETPANSDIAVCKIGIRGDRMNPPYMKDLACHLGILMSQNLEIVLFQSVNGLQRAAFCACRVVCELEKKTIFEVMQELKEIEPKFEINKAYF